MTTGSQLFGAAGLKTTLEGPVGASQSRMATFQLLPPLFSQLLPSLNATSICGALSGMALVEKV